MSRPPSVEVRVLASPTTEFALMLSVFWHSLRRSSGLENVRLTVFAGHPPEHEAAAATLAAWLPAGTQLVPVDRDRFRAQGLHGPAGQRLERAAETDLVICMDADMAVCGDLAGLVHELERSPAVAGVVAHLQPMSREEWSAAYTDCGLGPPRYPYRYTGWPYMAPNGARHPGADGAPPYFNFGFVAIPQTLLPAIAAEYRAASSTAERLFPSSILRSQIALTLALERAAVPHRALGMRYNFPNDPRLEALHPEELRDARVLHLLRRNELFDKRVAFRDVESLREFVASGWRTAGALELARRVVAGVLPAIESHPPPEGLAPAQWQW